MYSILDDKIEYNKIISKGKPIKIGERIIYPIAQILTFEIGDKLISESIVPFAIAVVEPENKYIIPLDKENDEINKLINKKGIWKELGLEEDN